MNTNEMMNKVTGVAGSLVMGVAFVSLFSAMGANASSQAKQELAYANLPIVHTQRVEVVGHAERTSAVNTYSVKAKTL